MFCFILMFFRIRSLHTSCFSHGSFFFRIFCISGQGFFFQTSCPWTLFPLSLFRTPYAVDIKIIVSPLMKTVPSFLLVSPSIFSSQLSKTVLICISNDFSLPISCLLFFNSTITFFPLASFKVSNGLNSMRVGTWFSYLKFPVVFLQVLNKT